eukprot:maker-scaffold52_size450388-snap-gene-2.18 protein:Tk02872 transcript:maker-scaffold52_size450388-snap-gene-2.18-mRNA-1 annotation:"hypothetical protein EUGRSUZ_A02127"
MASSGEGDSLEEVMQSALKICLEDLVLRPTAPIALPAVTEPEDEAMGYCNSNLDKYDLSATVEDVVTIGLLHVNKQGMGMLHRLVQTQCDNTSCVIGNILRMYDASRFPGFDPNAITNDGETAFMITCRILKEFPNSHVTKDVFRCLVVHPKVNVNFGVEGQTPLHLLLYCGDASLVELMLKNGAEVDPDPCLYRPLLLEFAEYERRKVECKIEPSPQGKCMVPPDVAVASLLVTWGAPFWFGSQSVAWTSFRWHGATGVARIFSLALFIGDPGFYNWTLPDATGGECLLSLALAHLTPTTIFFLLFSSESPLNEIVSLEGIPRWPASILLERVPPLQRRYCIASLFDRFSRSEETAEFALQLSFLGIQLEGTLHHLPDEYYSLTIQTPGQLKLLHSLVGIERFYVPDLILTSRYVSLKCNLVQYKPFTTLDVIENHLVEEYLYVLPDGYLSPLLALFFLPLDEKPCQLSGVSECLDMLMELLLERSYRLSPREMLVAMLSPYLPNILLGIQEGAVDPFVMFRFEHLLWQEFALSQRQVTSNGLAMNYLFKCLILAHFQPLKAKRLALKTYQEYLKHLRGPPSPMIRFLLDLVKQVRRPFNSINWLARREMGSIPTQKFVSPVFAVGLFQFWLKLIRLEKDTFLAGMHFWAQDHTSM